MASADGFTVVGAATVAATSFLRLERLHLSAPDGAAVRRDVVRHPGAVAVVAVVSDGVDDAVALLRQYRAPVDAEILEIPAGKLDIDGEDPADAVRRELAEEAGLVPGSLRLIADFYSAPGFTDERMRLYLATGCTPTQRVPHGVEEEAAELVMVPVADLPAMISAGVVGDAKSLVGLLMLLGEQG